MKAAFVGSEREIERVFRDRRSEIERLAEVLPGVVSSDDPRLAEVEVLFSTWGMPVFTEVELDAMPHLKAVFYAAGTVAYFADPLVKRGIAISSAWHANAVPVAEFTLSQILLSCKGYFANLRSFVLDPAHPRNCPRGPGAYGETIALLGVGAVGSKLVELLKPFQLRVMVFDPFMTQARADELGVNKASLEACFRDALVVSNHLLDVPDTYGLIAKPLLESMRPGATFINTGRGRTVVTDDLVEVLASRPDLTALLDVTDPEPLPPGNPIWAYGNANITTHIAGSIGDEVGRLADCAIEEFQRFGRGEPLKYQVIA